MFRKPLRTALEWRALAPVRFVCWLYLAWKDHAASKKAAASLGTLLLDIYSTKIFSNPDRNTLFILGSGSSINELTSDHFAVMKKINTIGVNFWFLHDFIPTVYSLDSGRPRAQSQQEQQAAPVVESRLGRDEILAANPPILLLRPYDLSWNSVMAIPNKLKKNVIVGGRANGVTKRRENLRLDLTLLSMAVRHRVVPHAVLPDNGASVVRLIFLAIAQRFRNIVLLGVDLDDRPHFFASTSFANLQQPIATLFPPNAGKQHGTTNTEDRPFNTVDVISDLARVVETLGLGKIWVGSETSALANTLPVYLWEKVGS